MHRRRTSNAPRSASQLPPFGGAGWLVSVLSEPGRGPAIRPEPDLRSAASPAGIVPPGDGTDLAPSQRLAVRAASWLATVLRTRCAGG